jgi:hypothetical protein
MNVLFSLACLSLAPAAQVEGKDAPPPAGFYLPENPAYTIVDSAIDSLRFTAEKTLRKDAKGHLVSISSFVNPEGEVMGWHDFGNLEGPGWAANAVGGAYELYAWGRLLDHREWRWEEKALSILDHVLDCGFVDEATGFIKGYRDTVKDELCLNYKHSSDWFCPGSMAKIAFQMLLCADELKDEARKAGPPQSGVPKELEARTRRLEAIAAKTGKWCADKVPTAENGWFPRRMTPAGEIYRKTPEGGDDKFWQTSADGLFIIQLWTGLTRRGLADHKKRVAEMTAVFTGAGGIFGSINHDTYDPHESVAYAVAFRTLLEVSRLLGSESIRDFAHSKCLAGLDQFKMAEDRNGVATRGLLYMEKSWPTAYLWENAEAALALFEAAADLREANPERAKRHEIDGLTILRAISKHHHGPHGFLTEGVDWSNHVGEKHHIRGEKYGDIQYTEPFLNNQHIAEPTLYYLRHLARKPLIVDVMAWDDCEGHRILDIMVHGGRIDPPPPSKYRFQWSRP